MEFAQAGLAPAQLDLLMNIQYAGQKASYGVQYPGGNEIVLLDGKAIGRMWLYRGPAEHHLVDISLMAEFRNRGIGAALLREAIAAAQAAGVRLCCSVAATNHGSLAFPPAPGVPDRRPGRGVLRPGGGAVARSWRASLHFS